jgi:hypothetical protein
MADFNNKWIEIFRAGDYGDKGVWTAEDVRKMAANFDPAHWQPPAVLGHPKEDAPAYGLVAALREENGGLFARFEKVAPELEQLAKDGRYPNRSAAIYANPRGNGPVLRHVGFLGATPPEVKGLAQIKFSDGEFIAVEFKEEEAMPENNDPQLSRDQVGLLARFAEGLRNIFRSDAAAQPAAAFTEEQVQKRIEAATKPLLDAVTNLSKKFEESVTESRRLASEATNAQKLAEVAAFIEKRKAANQWVPAFTEAGLDKVLEDLALAGGKVKFGEAGKEKEITAYAALCTFLERVPAIVPSGTLATGAPRRSKSGGVTRINETPNLRVDPNSVFLNDRAEEIAKEQKIEFGEALKLARAEMGDGAAAGAIAAGRA